MIFQRVTLLWGVQIVLKVIRDITPKLSKGEQPFLYETRCLNLISIAVKFHHDIPKPYIVIEYKLELPYKLP